LKGRSNRDGIFSPHGKNEGNPNLGTRGKDYDSNFGEGGAGRDQGISNMKG